MSVINKLKQMFSKKETGHVLGIALRPNSLAYCFVSAQNSEQSTPTVHCKQVSAGSVEYHTLLSNLLQTEDLQGRCQLILSANQYQIVQVEKPDLPDQEIAAALRWQVKDLVSYSPEDMVLDYYDAPQQQGVNAKLNVVCSPASPLKNIVDVLNNDALTLENINIEEFAFASLLPFSDDAQLMLCQQPDEDIFIIIVKQGQLCFQRRLRGFMQIGSKTEEELGFGIIDSLSLEIQKSVDYFERQLKQSVIKSIQVVLPIKTEVFVVSKLAENTHVPVHLLELPQACQQYRDMAAAVGALLLNEEAAKTLLQNNAPLASPVLGGEHE